MATTLDILQVSVKSTGVSTATTDLRKLGEAAEKTEQKVKNLVDAVDKMVSKFTSSVSSTKALSEALSVVNKSTMASDAAMKNLNASLIGLSKQISTLNAGLQQGSSNINNNTKHIVHHTAAMSDAHAAARGLTGSLGALWLTYGNVAPLAAGAAIGASLKAIVSVGADVGNTLENIRVRTGSSADEMILLGKTISDLGQGIYGPQEVSKALEALTLAGLNAKQAVTAIGAALNLATSGGTTIEKSAESLVTIGTAVGATSSEYDMLGDAIQKTANISLASVDSIAESVKRASVVNKLYGASFEDILTQTAALAQLGIKNTAAGTAITNFYANARAETEKAKKAVDALGFSFQDASGKAKPIVQAVKEYGEALSKFDENSQKNLITAQFGERSLRDITALIDLTKQAADESDKYANKLEEIQAQIKNSAGTAAIAAAQQALTTENQFKAVANTLKTSFGDAFKAIEPEINSIARKLREVFASDDFKTLISNVARGFATLAKVIADNIGPLTAVAEGFLLVGAAMAGGALFTKLIPVVQGAIVVMTGLATSLTAAGTAAQIGAVGITAFSNAAKFLPGIGIAIGLVAGAFALYSLHAKDAAKASAEYAEEKRKMAEDYNKDFIQSLDDEINRLTKINKYLDEGKTAIEAQRKATEELAAEKQRSYNKEAELAAQKAVDDAKKKLDQVGSGGFLAAKGGAIDRKTTAEYQAVLLAQQKLNEAKNVSLKFEEDIVKKSKQIADLVQQQTAAYKAREDAAAKANNNAAGDQVWDGGNDSKAGLTFFNNLIDANNKWVAGHNSRMITLKEELTTGKMIAGEVAVQEALAALNSEAAKKAMEGMNAVQVRALQLKVLQSAVDKDNIKFEEDKAQALAEFNNKLQQGIVGYEAYKKSVTSGSQDIIGGYGREAQALAARIGLTEQETKALLEKAKAQDLNVKYLDNAKKLEAATGSSLQRAEQFADELAIMEKYGVAVKQTAVEFAKAELEKRKFSEDSVEGKSRMGAAGVEDLNKSLLDLQKIYMGLQQWQESQAQLGLESTLGVETAKVAAYQRTAEKAIDFEQAKAQAAIDAQLAAGQITEGAADVAYMQLEARINKIKGLLNNKLSVDFKIAGLKDVANQFDSIADVASKLGKGFEGATKALGGFSNAFKNLADAEKVHGKNESKMQTARLGFYGDLADASKSFFHENTAGYKALDGVAKIFHTAQLARNLLEMGQLAIKAVMGQAQGDPYTAWGRMAAMAAVMAGLGFAVGGGFNNSAGGESAANVQEKQGTGGVFGDSKAKSESISRSIELMEKNSSLLLPLTQGMLVALKNIEASMSGLANLVVRSGDVTTGKFANTAGSSNVGLIGSTAKLADGFGPIGTVLGALTSAILGKTTKTVVDAGIQFSGLVKDLQQGVGFSQYASVDTTKKSLFGLVKRTSNSVETQGLDSELSKQFGLIFTNLESALKSAAGGFGKSGDDVGAVIANTVIDSAKVSLKDLKGDELTAAINSVISKAMDDIAMAAFPGLTDFRKVGEGYAETVLRVSSGIEQSNVALEKFNIHAINYVDIVNKQGDVASEIFKQSVLAVEQFNGVRDIVKNLTGDVSELASAYKSLKDIQNQLSGVGLNGGNLSLDTIKGAGGLNELQGGLQDYFDNILTEEQQLAFKSADLAKQFANLGVSVPTSKAAFESLVKSVDDGSVAGNKLVGQLLILSGAFADVTDAAADAAQKAKDAAEKAAQAAKDTAMKNVDTAFNALKRSVDAQKKVVKDRYDQEVAYIKAAGEARKKAAQLELDAAKDRLSAISKVYDNLSSALSSTTIESQTLTKARREEAMSYLNSVRGTDLTKASGLDGAIGALSGDTQQFFSTFEEYARDQAKAANLLTGLQNEAGIQKTFAELTVERLDATIETIISQTEAQLNQAQLVYENEVARLDLIVENAQKQIDALNGINISIISVKDALNAFASAVTAAKAVGVGSGSSSMPTGGILTGKIPSGGNNYMTSFWENTELDFAKNGVVKASLDVGTNYVPKDMPVMIHEGERVIPKADNAELMRRLDNGSSTNSDMSALCKEVADLKEIIRTGDLANVQQTREAVRILKKFDQDGLPPERDVDV